MARKRKHWEFLERTRKMPFTTRISNNLLQNAGFSDEEILVREAIQNSCDAFAAGSESPVTVRIAKASLTGARKAALVDAIGLGAGPADRKSLEGLPESNALHHIGSSRKPLSVVTIEDHYTHGLGGKWDGTGEHDHFGRLVVTLGNDDKAEGDRFSGGSFGFGKTVYGKASRIGIVVYYSVFKPTKQSGNAHARLMATGFFPPHAIRGHDYNGFAFFGVADGSGDDVSPFLDGEAHRIAAACGIEPRDTDDWGTTILIIDCNLDLTAMRVAAERYWWPRLIRHDLVVSFDDGADVQHPRPRKNEDLTPFIECYRNLADDVQSPPRSKVYAYNRYHDRNLGRLSCVALDRDAPLANHVALIRQPGMVVQYNEVGNDGLEPCVGLFHAHEDVDKLLTYSEPPSHHEWDLHAQRLKQRFDDEGVELVRAIHDRVGKSFREFQRMQAPAVPEGGPLPRELSRVLGQFLNVPGGVPGGGPSMLRPTPRPVFISVQEDRTQQGDNVCDTATVTLAIDESVADAPERLECTLSVQHEILGDASHRLVGRSSATIVNARGKQVASGSPATLCLKLKKGHTERLMVSATARTDHFTRYRVTVEQNDVRT